MTEYNGTALANGHAGTAAYPGRLGADRTAVDGAGRPPALTPPATSAPPEAPAGDRDPLTGRFVCGNKAARGNPQNRKMAAARMAFAAAISEEDLARLARALLRRALDGDTAAAQVLHYVCGRPGPAPDPDSLDLQEVALLSRMPTEDEVAGLLGSRLDAGLAADLVGQFVRASSAIRLGRGFDADELRRAQEAAAAVRKLMDARADMASAEAELADPEG
jgi:hypothetical protein